jgi:hypothetical protein
MTTKDKNNENSVDIVEDDTLPEDIKQLVDSYVSKK